MSKSAKRSLKPAYYYRNVIISFSDFFTINDYGSIRSFSHFSAGRIRVLTSRLFSYGVMSNHRINIAGREQKAILRPAETHKIACVFPIRLRQHTHPKSLRCQHTCNYSCTKAGMIHICVTGNINKIRAIPSERNHFFFCYR